MEDGPEDAQCREKWVFQGIIDIVGVGKKKENTQLLLRQRNRWLTEVTSARWAVTMGKQ
jgi:hypothetical protein